MIWLCITIISLSLLLGDSDSLFLPFIGVAIWGFVGHEGGGKTTAMTRMMLLHQVMGGQVRTFPGYTLRDSNMKRQKEISIRELVTMSSELSNVIVGIDEIQQFNDSSRHMTVINQLMGYVGMQRRKLSLGIFYSVQNWRWLYNRLRELTHLLTVCKDMRHTPWGKANNIPEGEYFSLRTFDCKGFLTGVEWQELDRKMLHGTALRKYFDSYTVIDIYEGMRKILIKKPVDVFDLRDPKDIPAAKGPPPEVLTEDHEGDIRMLQSLAEKGVDMKTLGQLQRRFSEGG